MSRIVNIPDGYTGVAWGPSLHFEYGDGRYGYQDADAYLGELGRGFVVEGEDGRGAAEEAFRDMLGRAAAERMFREEPGLQEIRGYLHETEFADGEVVGSEQVAMVRYGAEDMR